MKLRRVLGAALAALLMPTSNPDAQISLDWENGVLGNGVRCILEGPAQKFIMIPSPQPGPSPLSGFFPGDPRVLQVGLGNMPFWRFGMLGGVGNPVFVDYIFPPDPSFSGLNFYGQAVTFPGPAFFIDEISNPISFGIVFAGENHRTVGAQIEPRSEHTATRLDDGTVFLAGGLVNIGAAMTFSTSYEIFDPLTQTFRAGTDPLNGTRRKHTATKLPSGRVLLVGGVDPAGNAINTVDIYDPVSGNVTPGPPIPGARALHTATLLDNGNVLVVGGVGRVGPDPLGFPDAYLQTSQGPAVTQIYRTSQNAWVTGPALPRPVFGHRSSKLPDGTVLITGGIEYFQRAATVATTRIYTPLTNSLSPGQPLPERLAFHNQIDTLSGKVLVAGGALIDASANEVTPSLNSYLFELTTPDLSGGAGLDMGWMGGPGTGEEVVDGEVICVPSGSASGPDWIVEYIIVGGYEDVDPNDFTDATSIPNVSQLAIDENFLMWRNLGPVLDARPEGQLNWIDDGLRYLISGAGFDTLGQVEPRGEIHVRTP